MRTTSDMRQLWHPPCGDSANDLSFGFWNGVYIAAHVAAAEAYEALDSVLEAWRYAPKKGQTWAHNCRRITGGSGYSLHAYGIAVDINSVANPYGGRLVTDMPRPMVEAIEAIRTKGGARVFRWGGDWDDNNRQDDGSYDAMHFEMQASPAELRQGIDWNTVSAARVAPDEEDVVPYRYVFDGSVWLTDLIVRRRVSGAVDLGYVSGKRPNGKERTEDLGEVHSLFHGSLVDITPKAA